MLKSKKTFFSCTILGKISPILFSITRYHGKDYYPFELMMDCTQYLRILLNGLVYMRYRVAEHSDN